LNRQANLRGHCPYWLFLRAMLQSGVDAMLRLAPEIGCVRTLLWSEAGRPPFLRPAKMEKMEGNGENGCSAGRTGLRSLRGFRYPSDAATASGNLAKF